VFRPTGIVDLFNRRVGIYGLGLEGRTTLRAMRSTTEDIVVVDDAPQESEEVLLTSEGGLEELLTCDVVFKSPGIPPTNPAIVALKEAGVYVTSMLNVWMEDFVRDRVIAITGTKGKSTTTKLVEFFLQSLGQEAQATGNIGWPPYDPRVDYSIGWMILELSSFQTVDFEKAPAIVAITSLGSDHIDWHGSHEKYVSDKLSITRQPGAHFTLVQDDPALRAEEGQIGGVVSWVSGSHPELTKALHLIGEHNLKNVEMALAIVAVATDKTRDEVAAAVMGKADTFVPLPGRLAFVDEDHAPKRVYIDDGLATAVLPVEAALSLFPDEPLVLLAGGFDRGIDYQPLADTLNSRHSPTAVLTMGPAGERLGALLTITNEPTGSMDQAIKRARQLTQDGGVILLSPGAPSFDQYENWEARSKDFVRAVKERNINI
jgi:UDP-N-acetylmuramoylalanine--D-glutamate ligase